mmetsp:Transcript_29133/g.83508  ORF Transcript_29133/g.83508 Transcript_29133/m.83508 type:complete len:801 (-) Transcript_29133:330-2732(-)
MPAPTDLLASGHSQPGCSEGQARQAPAQGLATAKSNSSPEGDNSKGAVSRSSAGAKQLLHERAAGQSCANQCHLLPQGSLDNSKDEMDEPESSYPVSDVKLHKLIRCLDRRLHERFDRLELQMAQLGAGIAGPSTGGMQAVPHSDACTPHMTPRSSSDRSNSSGPSGGSLQEDNLPELPAQRRMPTAERSELQQPPDSGPCIDHAGSSRSAHRYSLRREWRMDKSYTSEFSLPMNRWRTKTFEDGIGGRASADTALRQAHWWIIWPSTNLRLIWDIVTMMLVVYDMAIIPVNLSFNPVENVVSDSIFWPGLIFWTVDIPLTFLTGYYRRGRVETRLSAIALHYLLTWFVVDIFIVGSSWFEVISSMETEGFLLGRVGKSLRTLRVLRSLRLLRLVKMQRIIDDIQIRITSEYILIAMTVLKLSLVVLWLTHFTACIWWAIGDSGTLSSGTGEAESWVQYHGLYDFTVDYQYMTSLHWSLTQFTPASMEVSPHNLSERIFAVCVLLTGMMVFSSLVGSITAAMTQLRHLSTSADKNFLVLRRFLHIKQTPADLSSRILRCVEYRLKEQEGDLQESDVHLLKYLSKPLHMEVLAHVIAPLLTTHPFFMRYAEADPIALQRLCLLAVQRTSLCTGDALFPEASKGQQMFFLQRGKLHYYLSSMATRSASLSEYDALIEEGEWFCEGCLWSSWEHWGTMLAAMMSEVLVVDAQAFAAVTTAHRLVASSAKRYGTAFVAALNASEEGARFSDVAQLPPQTIAELARHAFIRWKRSGSTLLPESRPEAFAPGEVEFLDCPKHTTSL